MTKIKIIAGTDARDVDARVNEFCKHRKIIDIKYSSFMLPEKLDGLGRIVSVTANDRVMIIYEGGADD